MNDLCSELLALLWSISLNGTCKWLNFPPSWVHIQAYSIHSFSFHLCLFKHFANMSSFWGGPRKCHHFGIPEPAWCHRSMLFPLSRINEAQCGLAYWFLFLGVIMPTDGCHWFSPLLIPRVCLESTVCPLHAWLFSLVVSQTSLHMCTIFINYIHIRCIIVNKIKLICIRINSHNSLFFFYKVDLIAVLFC